MKVDFLKRRKEMLESVERQFMGIDQAQIDELKAFQDDINYGD